MDSELAIDKDMQAWERHTRSKRSYYTDEMDGELKEYMGLTPTLPEIPDDLDEIEFYIDAFASGAVGRLVTGYFRTETIELLCGLGLYHLHEEPEDRRLEMLVKALKQIPMPQLQAAGVFGIVRTQEDVDRALKIVEEEEYKYALHMEIQKLRNGIT